MDLKGFTGWSSTRTPVEVFDLLEAIFGAFDKLAARRKVFKVETIGDSYVAVAGLPEAQPDHAVIMAKFARDCLLDFSLVINRLADTLGSDTANLEMRVGLHSGSTTGGVLRGEKGRFQLFGDTVNTASRMESTGVPGRIHCSQATADALSAKGKSSWLSPRNEKVVAKGKGEMQTYFVDPSGTNTKSVGTTISSVDEDSADSESVNKKEPDFESQQEHEKEPDVESQLNKKLNERLSRNLSATPTRFL